MLRCRAPAQVDKLVELGVEPENILTRSPLHAEQNILGALLPDGTQFVRWGIAWGSNNSPNPCSKCKPSVKGIIEGTEEESC